MSKNSKIDLGDHCGSPSCPDKCKEKFDTGHYWGLMGEQVFVCILSNVSTVSSLFVDTSQLQTSPIIIHPAHYLSSLWLKAYHSKF